MRKKYKVILKLIILIIIIILAILLFKNWRNIKGSKETKVIDTIDSFNYTLDDRDTKLMKDNYNELKSILKEKEINEEEYAKVIAKLFIIDLFTLDNKNNKYDVGGIEYVYPKVLDNFKLNVENTLYKTLPIKSNRKSNYPIVKTIDVVEIKEDSYKLNDQEYSSYIVTLAWDYEKDLGYDTKAKVTLIKEDNYYYVVEYQKLGE